MNLHGSRPYNPYDGAAHKSTLEIIVVLVYMITQLERQLQRIPLTNLLQLYLGPCQGGPQKINTSPT
jgi:hypothetical protein